MSSIELVEDEQKPIKKAAPAAGKKKPLLKKLDPETAKLLTTLNEKANKKTHGRRIRDSEIIHLGLTLIGTKDLETLKQASLTEKDRLNIAHEEYQKQHGKITLDAFIGKLLRGDAMTQVSKA